MFRYFQAYKNSGHVDVAVSQLENTATIWQSLVLTQLLPSLHPLLGIPRFTSWVMLPMLGKTLSLGKTTWAG